MNGSPVIDSKEYRRRIRAWTMYDWANSAFATTVLAAVLPVYYSKVAGATLPNPATATAYWSIGLSVSLLIVAILSPILGTVSDLMRGKKKLLAVFAGAGIVATGLLILVSTGDWLLASLLFVFGRIGFTAANVFYDALLPHVAKPEDQDSVSTRGYATGYLGGGLLLAINVVMIQLLPGTWGPRLSFLSVAIWWAVFSLPLFFRVPEPSAATSNSTSVAGITRDTFGRLFGTLKEIKRYRDLFLFLLAFLIYIDAIGTIIGMAGIYGAELKLGSTELILALLLVQFVGIPFSLIFGRLPSRNTKNRHFFLAFMLMNVLFMPVAGILGSHLLPDNLSANLIVIIGIIAAIELLSLVLAFITGPLFFRTLAERMTTKYSIYLALIVYTIIAIWGYFLHSIIEFWCLAWLVATVQGGSQALSRSLYSSMIPASKSGEFFGIFGVMEKFASFLGPLIFAAAGLWLGSTRPAVLSLVVFFIAGMIILSQVDVERGRRVAAEENARS